MADVKIVVNRDAVRQLLRSPEIQADLTARAQAIAAAAGAEGGTFELESFTGANRARATVWTADAEAREAEATDRVLTRAIDAGR